MRSRHSCIIFQHSPRASWCIQSHSQTTVSTFVQSTTSQVLFQRPKEIMWLQLWSYSKTMQLHSAHVGHKSRSRFTGNSSTIQPTVWAAEATQTDWSLFFKPYTNPWYGNRMSSWNTCYRHSDQHSKIQPLLWSVVIIIIIIIIIR
jgi:hypothetical protein